MKNIGYAFRYLLKSRGNNTIRILSLTLGLAFGVILFSYINYTLNFDRDLPNKERVFKINGFSTSDAENKIQQTIVAPVAPCMQNEIPQVEAATHIYGPIKYDYKYNQSTFPLTIIAIDSMFFDVLDYGVIMGNPKEVYSNSKYVMLSETQAEIMFGADDPIGKVIISSMDNEKIVCGIFKDPPFNNHLGEFNMLISMRDVERNCNMEWDGNRDFQTYVKLLPNTHIQDVEAQIPAMIQRHGADEKMKQLGLTFFMQPITKVHSHEGTRMQTIYLLALLALLLIMISAVNYVLLSVSSFARRAKTVAMLRCNGAKRFDVAKIFLSETLIILLISVVLSVLLIFCFQKPFASFSDVPIDKLFEIHNIWVSLAVVLTLFIFAGTSPAIIFASIPLTSAFRRITESRRTWKKVMLFFQLSGVTFVISFLVVCSLQFKQLTKSNQGYKFDKLLFVNLTGNYNTFLKYESELKQLPQVEDAGTAYSLPAYGYSSSSIFDEKTDFLFTCYTDAVTPNYFNSMGMNFVDGQSFSQSSPINDVVVNEEFVRLIGWNGSSIDREIVEGSDVNKNRYRVVGVIKNFRVRADDGRILPLVFHNIRENMTNDNMFYGGCRTMVRLNQMTPENIAAVRNKIDSWYSTDNHHITIYSDIYAHITKGERSLMIVLAISSIITLLIAFIGLWGYLNDETNRLNKEIAIRRINGARVSEILLLLARGLSLIALPSILIGVATSYTIAQQWLQQFSNRIYLEWWVFALVAIIAMVMVFTIQISRTWRAANTNPVEHLKSEV